MNIHDIVIKFIATYCCLRVFSIHSYGEAVSHVQKCALQVKTMPSAKYPLPC